MIVKVLFSPRQLQDPRLTALLEQNGWEEDPLWGHTDAGVWFQLAAGGDAEPPKQVARRLVEPFLTIGHKPLDVKTQQVLLTRRIGAVAREISRHNPDRANQLYDLQAELPADL